MSILTGKAVQIIQDSLGESAQRSEPACRRSSKAGGRLWREGLLLASQVSRVNLSNTKFSHSPGVGHGPRTPASAFTRAGLPSPPPNHLQDVLPDLCHYK